MANYTGTFNIYNSWVEKMLEGGNTASDVFKVLLTTSTYTPSQTTHTVLTDVTNEVSGNGYARQTLTQTSNLSTNVLTFDASDAVFTASGGSIVGRYFVIYDDTMINDPLVGYGLLDSTPADVTTTDGNTLTLQWNASGIFTVTRS